MAAAQTYEPIATTTLGSSTSSYTFSSIPSTFTDLILVTSLQAGAAATAYDSMLYFNGDQDKTHYSFTLMYGNGSSVSSFSWASSYSTQHGAANIFAPTSNYSTTIIHINNYANTTTYKTALAKGGNAGDIVVEETGLWLSTSAINSLTVVSADGGTRNFTSGSTLTLYGIKAA